MKSMPVVEVVEDTHVETLQKRCLQKESKMWSL